MICKTVLKCENSKLPRVSYLGSTKTRSMENSGANSFPIEESGKGYHESTHRPILNSAMGLT